jgi:hypothetical protein
MNFSIGFLGVLLGLFNTIQSWMERRRELAVQEFIKALDKIEELSTQLTNGVENNVRGSYEEMTAEDHHRRNMHRSREIENRLYKIRGLIEKEEGERLLSRYTNFWRRISENYPVGNEGFILSSDSAEFKEISDALTEWNGHLVDLYARYVRPKLKRR